MSQTIYFYFFLFKGIVHPKIKSISFFINVYILIKFILNELKPQLNIKQSSLFRKLNMD